MVDTSPKRTSHEHGHRAGCRRVAHWAAGDERDGVRPGAQLGREPLAPDRHRLHVPVQQKENRESAYERRPPAEVGRRAGLPTHQAAPHSPPPVDVGDRAGNVDDGSLSGSRYLHVDGTGTADPGSGGGCTGRDQFNGVSLLEGR